MPQIGKSQKNQTKISRKEEIILSRLRIGHSHITHSYLLKKEEAPYCIPCQKPYTIKHILTECIDLELIRKKYYLTINLKQIFYEINQKNFLGYLKEVHLYSKIKKKTTSPQKNVQKILIINVQTKYMEKRNECSYLADSLLDVLHCKAGALPTQEFVMSFLRSAHKCLKGLELSVKLSDCSISFLVYRDMYLTFKMKEVNNAVLNMQASGCKLAVNFSDVHQDSLSE